MSKIISLHGKNSSLILATTEENLPQIVYWGKLLNLSATEQQQLVSQLVQPVPQAYLDKPVAITLLPTLGDGTFQANALAGTNLQSAWAPQFKLNSIAQIDQHAIRLIADDQIAQLQIKINLSLNEYDVLEQTIELINLGDKDYSLDNLSLSLILPAEINQIIQFHGRWIHEFQTQQSTWDQPNYYVENLKGRSSNDNPALLMLGETGCSEQNAAVYGFHLAWSGNHQYKLISLNDGRRLVQFAEKLLPGEIILNKHASYITPTLYASYSAAGFNGISANFHSFIRHSSQFIPHVLPYRPIHFNTWEAMYFEHDLTKMAQLIDRAADIGVERFILDDGWFKARNHERAGLGDWFIDQQKYPAGLTPIIEHVKRRGMQFGLWFEPEMVNPDSDLFRAHPEWMLQIQGYTQPLGRYQYVLNLALPEAYAYIHQCIYALLSTHEIGYIKWDMNRDLVQAGNCNNQPSVHQQVLAVYRLLAQLRHEFPALEIESCASGGARADLGILRYTNRVWTSDCNDALERQNIQRGFSYFFPPEIMGSHFGPEQAHTTNRLATLEYRILTNFFGHLGFEQNLLELSHEECQQLSFYLDLYKRYRQLIHSNQLLRLNSNDAGQNVYGVIDATQTQGLFAIAQNSFPTQILAGKLRIPNLNPQFNYHLKLLNTQENTGYLMKEKPSICTDEVIMSGRLLAQIGVQLPIMHPQSILLMSFEVNII